MQTIVALSGHAVIIRHWFEIDLEDASMEHGARIELRELAPRSHRGSESAAQLVTADRPLWRADLFDRLADAPGSFGVAHYHPEFAGNEPCARAWDPALTATRGSGSAIRSPAWARVRAGSPGRWVRPTPASCAAWPTSSSPRPGSSVPIAAARPPSAFS